MKKSITIIVLALIGSFAKAQSVTFTVDKNLPAPKKIISTFDEQYVAAQIINVIGVPSEEYHVLKTSFEGQQLAHMGKDNFYKCILQAYADHRPLVLSPDMVWLIISQGFSRYVNAHAEEMRDLLVFHEGKMELVVNSNNNILSPKGDWKLLLNDFSTCIARNTKGELADLMTADFTTTGIAERIASQISLMDVVKHYFIYTNIAAACGIPSIRLEGTPDDWQKVLDKARCLRKYKLEKWSDDLVAILQEFVEASKGNLNQRFWQGIVKKKRVDHLKTDNSCDPDPAKMTKLDGWFLKFFPNSLGETPDEVAWNHDMPTEMVHVNFRQVLTDPATGMPIDTIPMQLWAGFVGVEENAKTCALSPKIGWLARIGDEESDDLGRFKELNKYGGSISIDLSRGQEVPIALSKMEHIRTLNLQFWHSPVIIPEWLEKIPIDELHIMGEFTDEKESRLRQRFPNVVIERVDDILKSMHSEKPNKAKTVPQREITMKELDQIIEERGMVKAEERELAGDPVMPNGNNPRVLVSLTDEEQALVMSVNDLGFNLFRTVGTNESILLSPLGMTYALGQINNGAAGKTRTQINQVLGCNDNGSDKINNFCRKMLIETPKLDKLTTIEITNEFISSKSFTPKPAFTRVVKDSYDTKFMVSESDPLKFTLKNTIYFKGTWADKFRKINTRDEVFRGENGKEATVPMMNQLHQFFYTENDLCQALCLPYSNGAYQMIVLLPKEGKTVCDVAQSLTADSWKKMYDQMQRIDVDVKLPRFESESEVNLTGMMSPIMPNAFNMKKADFSNLFDVESCIGKINQVGRIKVDETGAEAFAATILQGDLGGLNIVRPETVRFHATPPFLYFIREWSTGAIFFIGQYMGR